MSAVEDPAPGSWQVRSSAVLLANWLLTVRTDSVRMSDEHYANRTVVTHPGAVVILALNDRDQVLMIKQYRHPVGRELWELPAGLRDVDGESALRTARRELLEETGWQARDWRTLADYFTSPGFTDERIRVFLARDLTQPAARRRTARPAMARPQAARRPTRRRTSSSSGCRCARRSGWRSRANFTAALLSLRSCLGTLRGQKGSPGSGPATRPSSRPRPRTARACRAVLTDTAGPCRPAGRARSRAQRSRPGMDRGHR